MCSSVVQGGKRHHIKSRKPTLGFIGGSGVVEAPWRGFARIETIKEKWLSAGTPVRVPASSYQEKGHNFTIPEGKAMLAVVLQKKRFGFPEGTLLLVTRPAVTEEEIRVHPRHPKLVDAA